MAVMNLLPCHFFCQHSNVKIVFAFSALCIYSFLVFFSSILLSHHSLLLSSYKWCNPYDLVVYTDLFFFLLQWLLMGHWIRQLWRTMWEVRRTCTRTSGAPTTAMAMLGEAESSLPSMRYHSCNAGCFLAGWGKMSILAMNYKRGLGPNW